MIYGSPFIYSGSGRPKDLEPLTLYSSTCHRITSRDIVRILLIAKARRPWWYRWNIARWVAGVWSVVLGRTQ